VPGNTEYRKAAAEAAQFQCEQQPGFFLLICLRYLLYSQQSDPGAVCMHVWQCSNGWSQKWHVPVFALLSQAIDASPRQENLHNHSQTTDRNDQAGEGHSGFASMTLRSGQCCWPYASARLVPGTWTGLATAAYASWQITSGIVRGTRSIDCTTHPLEVCRDEPAVTN
jgi:hypothetical protein